MKGSLHLRNLFPMKFRRSFPFSSWSPTFNHPVRSYSIRNLPIRICIFPSPKFNHSFRMSYSSSPLDSGDQHQVSMAEKFKNINSFVKLYKEFFVIGFTTIGKQLQVVSDH
jgi:hypothetical protein